MLSDAAWGLCLQQAPATTLASGSGCQYLHTIDPTEPSGSADTRGLSEGFGAAGWHQLILMKLSKDQYIPYLLASNFNIRVRPPFGLEV